MLQNYFPIYQIALEIGRLRRDAELIKAHTSPPYTYDAEKFCAILDTIKRECPDYGLTHTSEMAACVIGRPPPETYADLLQALIYLNDSLSFELSRDSVFRIPPDRKDYFEHTDLFGTEVAAAFSSCARDIERAGSCYALGQEDACVHHLMLVLERGLNALAAKFEVPSQRTNWQKIIEQVASKLKSKLPNAERDFYLEINAQFGFLKDAYRNHSEHARDDPYDMEKALSILNHVRGFMQALAAGGLSE